MKETMDIITNAQRAMNNLADQLHEFISMLEKGAGANDLLKKVNQIESTGKELDKVNVILLARWMDMVVFDFRTMLRNEDSFRGSRDDSLKMLKEGLEIVERKIERIGMDKEYCLGILLVSDRVRKE